MNLYGPQMKEVARIIAALDALDTDTPEGDFIPYAQFVPIFVECDLAGFLTDDVGGAYSYEAATPQQVEWWSKRPR